jgi:hypothetical protein
MWPNSLLFHYFHFRLTFGSIKELGSASNPIHYINNYLAIILYYFNDLNENRCVLSFHFSALECWLCCNCLPLLFITNDAHES